MSPSAWRRTRVCICVLPVWLCIDWLRSIVICSIDTMWYFAIQWNTWLPVTIIDYLKSRDIKVDMGGRESFMSIIYLIEIWVTCKRAWVIFIWGWVAWINIAYIVRGILLPRFEVSLALLEFQRQIFLNKNKKNQK